MVKCGYAIFTKELEFSSVVQIILAEFSVTSIAETPEITGGTVEAATFTKTLSKRNRTFVIGDSQNLQVWLPMQNHNLRCFACLKPPISSRHS